MFNTSIMHNHVFTPQLWPKPNSLSGLLVLPNAIGVISDTSPKDWPGERCLMVGEDFAPAEDASGRSAMIEWVSDGVDAERS